MKYERIYLSSPHMGDKELDYIKDAFEKNWIAPLGENVNNFEDKVTTYIGMESAVALSSGTAALHLGLKALGVTSGDYVFCSSFTFSASCNPILYERAIPVFIDCDESWNMSPKALREAFLWAEKENKMPKAIIVVDLYGQSAKWDEIIEICNTYQVPILEDAAEALGATYKGKQCGSFGEISVLSFNGNKIITTSGGGMALAKDKEIRDKMFFWSTQSRENARHYEHKEIGYNYRLSNICAGIGCGQMDVLEERIQKKKDIYRKYKKGLIHAPIKMMDELANSSPTHWLSCMVVNKNSDITNMDVILELEKFNIESRPIWKPMHLQPIFSEYKFFPYINDDGESYSESVFNNGVCLPSDTKMSDDQQAFIISIIKRLFHV